MQRDMANARSPSAASVKGFVKREAFVLLMRPGGIGLMQNAKAHAGEVMPTLDVTHRSATMATA